MKGLIKKWVILLTNDSVITPRIELAVTSIHASSGRDATSVMAISEHGEHRGITASFENVSERNSSLHVFNTNDEAQNNIPDEVSELSVPGSHLDRQPHTLHIVTGQTAQTNQILELLT